MLAFFITIAILVSMALLLVRIIIGPTVYDRIVAVNFFGTLTVIFLVVLGYYLKYWYVLDIALVYALINFITSIAFLKFFRYKSFKNS